MSNYCNGTCPMYDAENGECCATDEPHVSVKPDAECFFDVYDHDHPYVEPTPTNADRIRAMSDEELEVFILRAEIKATKHALDTKWEGGHPLDWLKQEVEE